MRLVIARCSVDYEGRLAAYLPMATRLIMVKNDGCVAVHADGGAYKPLNWMCAPNRLVEGDGRWECVNPKGEKLLITIEEIFSDISHDFGEAPALEKDGVEKRLQELIAAQVGVLGEGWTLVRREYPTDIGPVDLLCRDPEGRAIAVEIKRRAEIDGVEQLTRYVERLNKDSRLRPVSGVLAYQQIKPQARVLAGERGFRCVELDYDRLRGLEPDALTLF